MKRFVSFDWAAKKLLRSKTNFGILEGFLSELLKEPIKIHKILESESNKDYPDSKYNVFDLLVENSKNGLILIEIQYEREMDYFQRMLFGSSKLIVDYLHESEEYRDIKKVISVNIIYFDIGQGEDYIYYGQTKFTGMNKKDILQLSEKQKALFNRETIESIFPEYYIIKVNQFNDVAKNTLDEWIYFLKNSDIKDDFKALGLSEAKRKLNIMKLSREEREVYERFIKEMRYNKSMHFSNYVVGLSDGILKQQKVTIENSIKLGLSIEQISQITNLNIDEINKIIDKKEE